jgi:hypothetical protein
MKPMPPTPIEALVAVLEQENAALAALDLVRAGALVERKRAAAEALAAATTQPPPPVAALLHLRDLAQQNKRLLERALAVQGRVIGIIGRAVPHPHPSSRYAAHGRLAAIPRSAPVALSARA